MKNTLKNSLIILGLLSLALAGQAQTILTQTTLSSAVTTSSTTYIPLTSVTGVTAGNTVLFVADGQGEAMYVNSVNTTANTVGVTRGYQSLGKARPHLSGAVVFISPAGAGAITNTVAPTGSCTRTNIPYLPAITLGLNGAMAQLSDCIGGVWVNGFFPAQNGSPFRVPLPNTGSVAYTSVGTNTAIAAATSMYCTELDVPYTKNLTGLAVLNGTTVGTDKHLVILYDSTGNLVANSAVAGATTSGASTFQTYAFTSKYMVVAPAVYFACLQSNGTTDSLRMLTTGTQDTYLTKAQTGQTFGTIAGTFTVPTTFTSVVGPVWALY